MSYKKLSLYAVLTNIVMFMIFFIDNTFLTDLLGYYAFLLILLISFIFYYKNKYDKKYSKMVVFKDILVAIVWIILSGVLGGLLYNLSTELNPCNVTGFGCFLYKIEYVILAMINMLFAFLILVTNLINLILKKTKLSDKKNIMISIPLGIITSGLIIYLLGVLL